ncbi:MAG TPA: cobalamin-independent methionine synthase II family protein [Dehalococcoidia bacterium]|nr:cobalamin-independent methionine synthase II family protein [Dehalococcoidia bacterium]
MKRSSERILTTHAGALPRPDQLIAAMGGGAGVEAINDRAAGLDEILRRVVPEVVGRQVEIGVDVVNDGEYGKPSWTGYSHQRLGGFEARPRTAPPIFQTSYDMRSFADYYGEAVRRASLWYRSDTEMGPPGAPLEFVCTGPISYTGGDLVGRDIANLTAALARTPAVEGFLPVAAPASVEVGLVNEHYASEEEFVFALAGAMAEEYRAITDAGLVVQIDDAWIPALWDRMLPDVDFAEYMKYCELRVEALNHALRGIPAAQVRYHICWGSWHGPHVSDIPMRDLIDLMLKVNADAYVFEAANVRHEHEYHLWETVKLPEGKSVIPGVVSHATNVVEHPELVAERIMRYAERVGRENVMAGTDCGLGGRVHPQVAWAKLGALVEGARLASSRLWARG